MLRFLSKLQPWAIFLVRLVVGTSMAFHGYEKLIPPGGLHRDHPLAGFEYFAHFVVSLGLPLWLGYVSVLAEFVGGLFVIVGLLTRVAAFFISINMLVALFLVNVHKGYGSSEYTLALIAMALLLITTGSGKFALDRRPGLS